MVSSIAPLTRPRRFPTRPNLNTLWAGFGGACQTQNAGDPIVLYDKLANRWLISQFTSAPDTAVTSISAWPSPPRPMPPALITVTPFAVPNDDFGDYPHYGAWTDAYYVMAHNFEPTPDGFSFVACSARWIAPRCSPEVRLRHLGRSHPRSFGRRPHAADLDGFAPPPGGAPGIFTSLHGDGIYSIG